MQAATFLFTDVERSTEFACSLGDGFIDVLVRQRDILRSAAERVGGRTVESRGDETFTTFDDANAAVSAAVSAQREIGADPLLAAVGMRVRVGVHSGEAAVTDGGYVGVDLHLAARVCEAGHGGQVLVTEATRAALRGVELVDLGAYWLNGLPESERIHQVVADGLETEFPPLRRVVRADAAPAARVVVADDSVLLREGLARLLEDSGFAVVGNARCEATLMSTVEETRPDLAIVDLRMPPTHSDEGLRAARRIRDEYPGTGVLVLSQYAEPAYARELLADGTEGVGYLLKDRVADVKQFAAAALRVSEGGMALDPAIEPALA